MNMKLSDLLRECINESPKSVHQIATELGLGESNFYKFMKGKRDLHVKTADKLIEYFNLEVIKRDKSLRLKLDDSRRYNKIRKGQS